jgi:predicted Zn-dependent peptidase
MYADDPQEKISEALMKHMYEGEPASRDVLGTKETVNAITREALVEYKYSQYTGPNTIVTIAGGIKEEDMLMYARANFSDLENKLPSPEFLTRDREQRNFETVFITKPTDQAHIVLAWRTFDRSHPDRYTANLIKHILKGGMSSRLFIRLRDEMGSGYYIGAVSAVYKSFGAFLISTGTKHERVPEIVSAILAETQKLSEEGVTAEELEKVKEYMRAHRLMSLETSDDVAEYCAEHELLEGTILTPAELDAIYTQITAEDVIRVAKALFDKRKLTVAAIGKGIDRVAVKVAIRS